MPEVTEMPEIEISEAESRGAAAEAAVAGERQFAAVGRAARKRQEANVRMRKRVQNETRTNSEGLVEGPLRPCTVINFNPVPLVIEMSGHRMTIPAPKASPERFQVKLPHAGRIYTGAYMVVSNPWLYHKTIGHAADAELANVDMPTTEVRYFSPHAIGCALYQQYNSPHFKNMGGVLVFDQNIHALKKDRLARTHGRLLFPERQMLEGDEDWSYSLREGLLEEELAKILQRQREYCDMQVQLAHQLWTTNDPAQQAMITETQRDWARFAVAMSYGLDVLPAWVTARLNVTGPVQKLAKCRYCQAHAKDPEAMFCHNCNAPYEVLAALRAGLHVPDQYVELLSDDDFAEAEKILKARRKRGERLRRPETPAAAAPKDSGKPAKDETKA